MTRIFADNVGIVQIYNKDVAVPANVEVVIKADGANTITSTFSVFTTGFGATKKSQFMPKQSLDNITHFIPFGHAPEVIVLSGITFGYQQTNTEGLIGAQTPRIDTVVPRYARGYAPKTLEEAKVKTFTLPKWMDRRTWFLETMEASAAEGFVSKVTSVLSTIEKVVNTAKEFVASVVGIPGAIMSGLGLSADKQLPATLSYNADNIPLTFPELHSLFDHMQLGSHDRASDGKFLNVDFCGVRYRCGLSQINFTAKSADNVIEFTMELMCIGDALHLAPAKPNIVRTRPAGVLSLLMQVTQAAGQAAMAGIRSSDLSAGPVSIGRLLG